MSLEHRLLVAFIRLNTRPDELRSMVSRRCPPGITLLMPPAIDILIVPHQNHPCVDMLKVEMVTESEVDESELQIHTRYIALEELL